MSDADQGRSAEAAAARADAVASGDRSTLEAGAALLEAVLHLLGACRKLAAAEGRLLRTSIPLLLVGGAALILFGLTLWFCLVALFVWLLMAATGSLELALGLLVLIHVLLVGGIGWVLWYALRQASFPRTRAQLRLLGRTLRYDFGRATGAIEDPLRPPGSADKSHEKEGAT